MPDTSWLVTPTSKTEFMQLVDTAKRFHDAMQTADEVIAAELRHSLPRARGKRFDSLRPDLKINAIRVSRAFVNAGAANLAARRSYHRAGRLFYDLFGPGTDRHDRSGFDLDS